VASALAGRPYDLRHAAVSLWLNAGVPATEVAERAGTACKSCCASTGYRLHASPSSERAVPGRTTELTPAGGAGQACSGGSAGLEPPGASGAILFSQQLRHSTCGRWCRPCSCSHATCAAPPTSSRSRPPPKRSPSTLGIRRSTTVHLPIDKAARSEPIAQQAAKSSVTPPGRAKVQDQPTLLG